LVSVKGKGTMKTYWLCPYGHNKDATKSQIKPVLEHWNLDCY